MQGGKVERPGPHWTTQASRTGSREILHAPLQLTRPNLASPLRLHFVSGQISPRRNILARLEGRSQCPELVKGGRKQVQTPTLQDGRDRAHPGLVRSPRRSSIHVSIQALQGLLLLGWIQRQGLANTTGATGRGITAKSGQGRWTPGRGRSSGSRGPAWRARPGSNPAPDLVASCGSQVAARSPSHHVRAGLRWARKMIWKEF